MDLNNLVSDKAGDKKTPYEKTSIILNPILSCISIFVFLVTGIIYFNSKDHEVANLVRSQANMASDIKELVANDRKDTLQNESKLYNINLSLKDAQNSVNKVETRVESLEIRINGLETYYKDLQEKFNRFATTLAQQSGDIRVIREIVQKNSKGE